MSKSVTKCTRATMAEHFAAVDCISDSDKMPLAKEAHASCRWLVGKTYATCWAAIVGNVSDKVPLAKEDPVSYWRLVSKIYATSGAAILGNTLEWYDWTVYGYMEDVMQIVFMHGSDRIGWLLFAIPFAARPIGSILFGCIGDRCGRAVALNGAIWGMAATTIAQGCLVPSLPGAVWMLCILRFLSGLSAGGEAAGVNTYMSEVGGDEREMTLTAAIGVNNVSGSLAFFAANFVALLVHQMPVEDLHSWGWRIPFLAAIPVSIASILMRRHMPETEDFKAMQVTPEIATNSDCEQAASTESLEQNVGPSWFESIRAISLVVLAIAAINSCNYLPVYLASWLKTSAGLTSTAALGITATSKISQMLMTFPASYLGDRYGASCIMIVGGVMTAVIMVPSMLLVMAVVRDTTETTLGVYSTAFVVLGIILPVTISIYLVPSNLYMTSLFPSSHRGRCAGVGLGLASIVGGITPLICTELAETAAWLPGLFVIGLAIPSLLALLWSRVAATSGILPVYQRSWLF